MSEVRALDPTSPHQVSARAGAGEELLEGGGVRIGVDLVRRIGARRIQVHHVLDRLHEGRIVDARLHGVRVEQPGLVVRVLGIGRRAVFQEVEAEAAPALERVEEAIGSEAGQRISLALHFLA